MPFLVTRTCFGFNWHLHVLEECEEAYVALVQPTLCEKVDKSSLQSGTIPILWWSWRLWNLSLASSAKNSMWVSCDPTLIRLLDDWSAVVLQGCKGMYPTFPLWDYEATRFEESHWINCWATCEATQLIDHCSFIVIQLHYAGIQNMIGFLGSWKAWFKTRGQSQAISWIEHYEFHKHGYIELRWN